MIASPADAGPVFDLIAPSRLRTNAPDFSRQLFAILESHHLASRDADISTDPAFSTVYSPHSSRDLSVSDTAMGRTILDHRTIQIKDLGPEPAYGIRKKHLAHRSRP